MNLKTRAIGAVGALAFAGGMLAAVAPAAHATDTPAGGCIGSKSVGKLVPGLGDQTAPVTISTSLLTDLSLVTPGKIGGACGGLLVPANNPGGPVPGTLNPKAIASKLTGLASCATTGAPQGADANYANRFAISGKQVITMTQTDTLLKPWQIQTWVTIKGFDPAYLDIVDVTGIVIKGPSVGATVSGSLYEDPISKLGPTSNAGPIPPKPWASGYTGYALDITTGNPLGCSDTTPGNANITQVQVGDGTSLLGNPASGLSFTYLGV